MPIIVQISDNQVHVGKIDFPAVTQCYGLLPSFPIPLSGRRFYKYERHTNLKYFYELEEFDEDTKDERSFGNIGFLNILKKLEYGETKVENLGIKIFYEYHISAKLHPPITAATIEGLFTIETMETALVSDITTTRQEQWQQSDDIAYNKSASVFRMLFHSLTESTFTEGLKIFLSQYSLNPTGVTTQRNLYDAWQRAVNIEQQKKDMENYKVEELFGCWEQVGYPILYVERSYNDHRVRFSQKSIIKDDNTTFWHIPVTYITNDNSTSIRKFWLHPTRQFEMLIDDLRPNSHLLVNVNRMGYYRVQYDEANWMLIARELSHLESSNLSPISRAIDFLQKLLTKVFSTYGIDEQDNEENHHKLMRNIVIEWSCEVHLQSCLDVTRDKLWSYFLDEESPSLSIDHEDIIFCHGLIMATKLFWLLSLFMSLILTIILITKLIEKVKNMPIIVQISDNQVHVGKIDFPAVTQCYGLLPSFPIPLSGRRFYKYERHTNLKYFYELEEFDEDTKDERSFGNIGFLNIP
ncbi:hypothetical protein PVAND_001489 [Polypedilum vanderplanki]|uniref:Peptidase M1 membrane alanine aminopeptidase domain-containing protein n=1 Tax=Polypedilum vanderplanki TaxID=319348 RepID=A0A9J6BN35_POLVA|nr:hypothetical protein PVAND_001489 [Polypedilum vanderplanki]